MLGRIACLAQTVEVFHGAFDLPTAYEMAHARRGHWFDPVLVDCLDAFRLDTDFWHSLRHTDVLAVRDVEPQDHILLADDLRLDAVAEAFARVVDAKSPSIANHSQNTAAIAVSMGWAMGMADRELRTLKRAAMLHDIGTLGVSNTILDKTEPLDAVEAETMRLHTRGTLELLKRVPRFRQFAATARRIMSVSTARATISGSRARNSAPRRACSPWPTRRPRSRPIVRTARAIPPTTSLLRCGRCGGESSSARSRSTRSQGLSRARVYRASRTIMAA